MMLELIIGGAILAKLLGGSSEKLSSAKEKFNAAFNNNWYEDERGLLVDFFGEHGEDGTWTEFVIHTNGYLETNRYLSLLPIWLTPTLEEVKNDNVVFFSEYDIDHAILADGLSYVLRTMSLNSAEIEDIESIINKIGKCLYEGGDFEIGLEVLNLKRKGNLASEWLVWFHDIIYIGNLAGEQNLISYCEVWK